MLRLVVDMPGVSNTMVTKTTDDKNLLNSGSSFSDIGDVNLVFLCLLIPRK